MHPLTLTSGSRKLAANLFTPTASNKKAVLLLHGWQSEQDRNFLLAEELTQKGYTCLTVDFGGHGKSEGDKFHLSRAEFLNDACVAYDALVRESKCSDISVSGSSFGSYIAALLTAERSVSRLILRVPADFSDDGFDLAHAEAKKQFLSPEWRGQKRHWNETRALHAIHAFRGPVLLIESELDNVCPHQCVQNFADAISDVLQLTHWVQKGAPHSLTGHPELKREYKDKVLSWM